MPDLEQRLDDSGRLNELRRSRLLDSPAEPAFDRLTTLASKIVRAPVSLVTLVEPDRQFFKSQVGLVEPFANARQTPIDYSFCQHVVMSGQPLVINDTDRHPLVHANPSLRELDVAAYLGIPLVTADGWNLGSFCVIDHVSREWTVDEIETMTTLAQSVASEIQLRLDAMEMQVLVAQLQARNENLDEFSHTVSHNLKNSISGIIGWTDVSTRYADRMTQEELLGNMQKIRSLATATNSTINALLLLAQIDRLDDIKLKRLPMFNIIEDALTRLELQIAECEARIILPETVPDCIGYREWVEEIWINYISNALKYGGQPPVIEFGAEALVGDRIRYWIKDNGAGIGQEDQANLFKKFSRLSQNATNIEGHGLGLSIVKRIIDKLDGEVGVESTPGEGSIFSFTLPAVPVT